MDLDPDKLRRPRSTTYRRHLSMDDSHLPDYPFDENEPGVGATHRVVQTTRAVVDTTPIRPQIIDDDPFPPPTPGPANVPLRRPHPSSSANPFRDRPPTRQQLPSMLDEIRSTGADPSVTNALTRLASEINALSIQQDMILNTIISMQRVLTGVAGVNREIHTRLEGLTRAEFVERTIRPPNVSGVKFFPTREDTQRK